MIGSACLPIVADVDAIRVDDVSAPGRARRVAGALAAQLGFTDTRVAEVEIAVTELGTNLHRHAREGMLFVRSVRAVEEAAVEVVAVDRGPGIANVEEAMRDGQSSTGTLGVGLGAVTRLADASAVSSEVGAGTVVTARFHRRRGACAELPGELAAGITRPIEGEDVCGDGYAVCDEGGRLRLMMCDGAGHGPLAAWASQAAVRSFHDDLSGGPGDILGRIHTAMRGTRGGAVAVADLDLERRTVVFAGLGNIAACVVAGGRKQSMVSVPGIAGYQARTIRTFDYALPAGAVVVLHSDGLTERWGAEERGGLFGRDSLVIAATLLRDMGVRKDDAGVLVARPTVR
ncbi:anti-sigma regulatory factor (Ser/Thr protein kinase) [Actinophytocola oryzae]|uniref:Anti-sigma regulatory factor (Ser/Thr protein kinase) n=1 Tax=Actinophytocola oryzae TaxID=502181 RepID=A0A4V3FQ37_9PSEU|nr:anti-sigma regulatory factor (Ser/Thr protein kinase) [Actinophytocola oryzae]